MPDEEPASPPAVAEEGFAGVPDGFGRLWTPHRMAYIRGEGKPSGPGGDEGCPFCRAPTLSDEDGLIVARGSLVYAVLNLYPYNAGHLMVVPYRHVADYTDLTVAETIEFASYTQRATRDYQAFFVGELGRPAERAALVLARAGWPALALDVRHPVRRPQPLERVRVHELRPGRDRGPR